MIFNMKFKDKIGSKINKKIFLIFLVIIIILFGSLFGTIAFFSLASNDHGDEVLQEEGKQEEISNKQNRIIGDENIIRKDLYPDLYVEGGPVVEEEIKKMAYITFDDGPSQRTVEIMDVLDKYNIKATFFVTGQNAGEESASILQEIIKRGHQIGVHTWSHNYKKIYSSIEAYLDDFYLIYDYIYKSVGKKPEVYRFPGGSVNHFNRNVYRDIINEMASRGFKYYDWNKSNDDSIGVKNINRLYKNSVSGISKLDRVILLCHDNSDKKSTVASLDMVIQTMIQHGFSFDVITRKVKPIVMSFK